MPKKLASTLRITIPLLLAILLLYFAFRNVEFADFLSKSKETNYIWVLASIVLSIFSYILRAFRWNLLLKPLGHRLSTFNTTLAVLIGYLANLAFPRLGEVTRCAILRRTDNVPLPVSLGSVITERLIDSLTLLSLIAVSFIVEFDLITTFLSDTLSTYNVDMTKVIIIIVALIVAMVGIFVIFLRKGDRRTLRIRAILRQLYLGISSIGKVENITAFLVSTVTLWLVYYLMAYIIVFSLDETSFLSISAGLMLLVTGGIALALPVQGGIGTYHAMVTALLMLYGINKTTGLFLATLLHTSQIVAIAVFGGAAVLLLFVTNSKTNESKQAKNSQGRRSRNFSKEVEVREL